MEDGGRVTLKVRCTIVVLVECTCKEDERRWTDYSAVGHLEPIFSGLSQCPTELLLTLRSLGDIDFDPLEGIPEKTVCS